jgi:hypothetical protein
MSLFVVRWAVSLLVGKGGLYVSVGSAVGLLVRVDAVSSAYRSGSADGASVPENEFFGRSRTVIFSVNSEMNGELF